MLSHQQVAGLVQHQRRLLVHVLMATKRMVCRVSASQMASASASSVSPRFDMGGRHQLHLMPQGTISRAL
ncbi:hypothetical protein AEJ54_32005 [Azospirillum sp. Sp 7]|nr:hypothetical protein AMK58_22265 [Azospirillum brasilense]OPH11920.1 hypothetical protein FE89_31095 [Azospirillum brasilense]PWC82119.1 hypothetical protein AEJ54_32005 [Azospirillum sp. Sp 7]